MIGPALIPCHTALEQSAKGPEMGVIRGRRNSPDDPPDRVHESAAGRERDLTGLRGL